MSYNSFDELIQRCENAADAKSCALVGAESPHALEAMIVAEDLGVVKPILCGDEGKIKQVLADFGCVANRFRICHCDSPERAATLGAALVNRGQADFIMKGQIETGPLMKRLLQREGGLRASSVVHSVAFAEIETYHKLLAPTDAAILVAPTLEQKKMMIENTVAVMREMG